MINRIQYDTKQRVKASVELLAKCKLLSLTVVTLRGSITMWCQQQLNDQISINGKKSQLCS